MTTTTHLHRSQLLTIPARVAAVALVAASMLAVTLIDARADDRPNFILCMADDQGWGDVGYNGNELQQTPVLDEMAATGLRFDRFYAAAPVCSPTRGSVLTGRHPNRFGCFSWGHTLRPQEVTVAEALKAAGYATGHFGKWHLGEVRKESPASPGNSGFDEWFSSPNFYENDALMSKNGKVVETAGESSMIVVDAALEFIGKQAKNEKPFLAVVWFGSPHTPHIASEELQKLYADQPEKLKHYLGEVTGIDRAMGRLRKELKKLGAAENTLLWYTSDNGARRPGSTGGLRGQKGQLWEGGVRVPAIIEWPARIQKPRTTNVPASTVDIYPTLLELAQAKPADQPKPLDGLSLVPLIDGRTKSREKPLGFWFYPERGRPVRSTDLLKQIRAEQSGDNSSKPKAEAEPRDARDPSQIAKKYPTDDFPGHAAWIDGDFKLHRIPRKSGGVDYKLYDLRKDRKESTDVAKSNPDVLARMKVQLAAWQKSVVESLNGADY